MIEVPYGRVPYPLDLGCTATVLELPTPPVLRALPAMIEVDLAASSHDRITVIVSDATSNEPRRLFLEALARHLPATRWTIAIATRTRPSPLPLLNLALDLLRDARLVHHDGHRATDLVGLGVTSRGTLIRVHRCRVEADLMIVTGCIRPHDFADGGAGTQAISPGPGLCAATAIRIDSARKTAAIATKTPHRPRPRPRPRPPLPSTASPDQATKTPHRPRPRPRPPLPSTASPDQSTKIAPTVAPLVVDSGMLPFVAECAAGISEVVNEAAFRIGVLPRMALGVARTLVSSLGQPGAARALPGYAVSANRRIRQHAGNSLTLPRASQLLFEAST